MANPAGETLAWDFIQSHWDAVQNTGGPFAGAEVMNATSRFCDANMRDRVTSFFAAHKVEAAAALANSRSKAINNCIDLKSQQAAQLASWLGWRRSDLADERCFSPLRLSHRPGIAPD